MGDAGDALFRRLAEADAGIEDYALAGDAGARRNIERAVEEGRHVGNDVDGRIRGLAVVHDSDRHATLGDEVRHVGIALQPPHVIDDRRTLIERPGGDGGFERIDRDRDAERDEFRQHRRQSGLLLRQRHANGAAVGARRFSADIEDIGALGNEAAGVGERRLRIEKAAAIGKRIRGDVEDAHNHWPRVGQEPRQHAVFGRRARARNSAGVEPCGHYFALRGHLR